MLQLASICCLCYGSAYAAYAYAMVVHAYAMVVLMLMLYARICCLCYGSDNKTK